jgi:hypothetical protein
MYVIAPHFSLHRWSLISLRTFIKKKYWPQYWSHPLLTSLDSNHADLKISIPFLVRDGHWQKLCTYILINNEGHRSSWLALMRKGHEEQVLYYPENLL